MEKMPWFTSKGQIIQTAVPPLGFLLALFVAWKGGVFQAMSENQFFSAGAILFYILITITLVSLWRTARMKRGQSPLHLLPGDNSQEEQKQLTYRESRKCFAEPWLRSRELLETLKALKSFGGGAAQVQIVYVHEEDVNFVNFIRSIFQGAGWQVNVSSPQPHLSDRVEGLHVRGCEVNLVDSVARAFERAEILGVKRKVDTSEVNRNDPRRNTEQRSIRIMIGD